MHRSITLLAAALLASSAFNVSLAATALPGANPANENATNAAPTALATPAVNAQLEKMQAAHAKLAAAKTPAERRLAMQEAMLVMQDSMHMMRGQTTENGCMGDMRMGMGMGNAQGNGMGMMDMMMKMMDQQSSMMKMPMGQ